MQRKLTKSTDYKQAIKELGFTSFAVETHWKGKERRHPKIYVNGLPLNAALGEIRASLDRAGIEYNAGHLRDVLIVMAAKDRGLLK